MRDANAITTNLLKPGYTLAERALIDAMQSRINVARAVLRARLDRGLSQEEVGRAAGTKQSRVSEIEGMKGNPRFDTLDRIARVLGLVLALVPRSIPVSRYLELPGYQELHSQTGSGIVFGTTHSKWAQATQP